MEIKNQMPEAGCSQCGAYADETQGYKRKRLVWDGADWVCRPCHKATETEKQ